MSKIYEEYKKLKEKEAKKMYLFESGNFYIFLDKDAEKINQCIGLKITPFCKEAKKCGFPKTSIETDTKLFKQHGLHIKIIPCLSSQTTKKSEKKIIKKIVSLNLNKITPIKALALLKELQDFYKK